MAQQNPWDIDWSGGQAAKPAQDGVFIPQKTTAREQAAEQRAQSAEQRAEQAAAREQIRFEQEQAAGGGAKPTEAQQKTFTLLTRISAGRKAIQDQLAKDPNVQMAGLGEELSRGIFGEGLITRGIAGAGRRIVTDSQADILDALLTLGTGAAYTKEQLQAQTTAYFPQYNDTEAEIAEKNKRLNALIEAARIQTGPLASKFDEVIKPMLGAEAAAQGTGAGPVALQVATGEKFATDRDIEIAQRASGIWSNRGISNDQAIQQLNELFQSYGLQPMAPEQANALRQDVERQTQWAPNPTGVRTGGDQETQAAIGAGLVSGVTAGLGEEALSMIDEQAAQKLQAATEYARETSPVLTTGAEIVGGILSPLARVGPAGTIAGEATRGAVYGGLYGAGQAPVEAGLEERLPGAVIGALTGGAAGGAAQRILGRAATPGAPVPPAAAAPEVPSSPIMEAIAAPPTAREVIEAGERANIPVMTSDIRPPETFMGQQAQRIGERIPIVGTGGPRATQQAARQEAVKDFILETAGAVPADVEERIVTDVLRKRGDVVEKYTTLKGEVFSNLAGAGEVAVDKTLKAIDDQIAELSKARTPAADEAIAKLTEIRTQAAGRDIQAMEAFRRDVLGKAWQDESLSVGASDRVKAAVKSLYGPFNEDMGKFILDRSGKRDYTKWRIANARLSDGIQEANRNTLKSILRSGEATPEVINNMLFSAKKSDVAALYRSLTPEGKAQARMAIVQRIAKDIGADTGDISPEKFLTQVRKRSDQLGVFFEKGQQEELKGLVRALQATRRAGGANVATQTGQENFALLLGGLGIGDIFTTGGIGTALALTFSGAVRAYESKAVRNLMASLGKTKPGSEAERTILSKISEKVGQVAKPAPAVAAGQISAQQAAPEQTPGAPIPQMPQ